MKRLQEYLCLLSFCFASIVQTADKTHPPRVDIGIILDTSSDMTHNDFEKAKEMLTTLLDNFSISPGTTRIGLYTISDKQVKRFHFKTHVNRKCLLKAIRRLKYTGEDKSYDFPNQIDEALKDFEVKSREVIDQQKIYLFVTSAASETDSLLSSLRKNSNIKMAHSDVLGIVSIVTRNNGVNRTKQNRMSFSEKNYKENKKRQTGKIFVHFIEYNKKSDISQVVGKLGLPLRSYTSCHAQGTTRDECNRECQCVNGELTNCYRVRQEFTAMTTEERRRYLKTYKTLTTTPPYKGIYERFIFMHYKYFCWGIHTREYFLPWHRWFISEMEDLLRQIDCRVTLPYWDWSHMSNNPWDRKSLWRATDDGLGGNGNMYRGYCVQKGIFRESEWELPYWEDPMDIILSTVDRIDAEIKKQRAHLAFCLRRAFKGHSPSVKSVQRTLALPAKRFKDFDIQIRHNYHDRIHNIIGGTMCTHYAGDTPEFFLHHAFLDKIWYMWQAKSPSHKFVHFLQRNTTKMMGCPHTQRELIDLHNLPRCIKVRYTKFPSSRRDKRNMDDIDDMARTSDKFWNKYMNESWYGNFPDCSRSKKERKRAKYLHKVLDAP